MTASKIFLCAGGTAGHVYPAIFTAQSLKKQGYHPIIITDHRGSRYCQEIADIKTHIIHAASPAQANVIKKLKAYILLMLGVIESLWLIAFYRPKILVGFGGYLAMPILCAGILTRRKMIAHEQNAILGKVNRLWARFSLEIALSFADTLLIKNEYLHKSIYIGNPVRPIFYDYQQQPKLASSHYHILVFGGSQGARIIAQNINDIFALVNDEKLADQFYFTVQSPQCEIDILQESAQKNNINANIAPFFDNLPQYIWQSDLVIARAGAATISELSLLHKNAILIPLAIAADNHQYHNAKRFAYNHHASIIEESQLTPNILWQEIQQKKLASSSESFKKLPTELRTERAEEKLARLIINHINI